MDDDELVDAGIRDGLVRGDPAGTIEFMAFLERESWRRRWPTDDGGIGRRRSDGQAWRARHLHRGQRPIGLNQIIVAHALYKRGDREVLSRR